MKEWISSPVFGIILCIASYAVGTYIQKKLKTPLANPLMIAITLDGNGMGKIFEMPSPAKHMPKIMPICQSGFISRFVSFPKPLLYVIGLELNTANLN
jgi:hypothetical protein